MTLGLAFWVAAGMATPAHAADWAAAHYPAMSSAILDMGVTAPEQAAFNTLYDGLKAPGALRCDGAPPAGTPRWDVTCVADLGPRDAKTCGVIAATAAMELRLVDLQLGVDRSAGVVLSCGPLIAQGYAMTRGPGAGQDGRVQADVRKSGVVVWTRTSTALSDWTVAPPADRLLTPEAALTVVNTSLAARAPADDAWIAMANSLSTDSDQFEPLRVKLVDLAKAAAVTARAAPTSPQGAAIQAALVARLDAYVTIGRKLMLFVQLAADGSTQADAQKLLDQASADSAAADQAFMAVVGEFAARYGLADNTTLRAAP